MFILGRKQRIDQLVVEKGFETSRERAKALIMAGEVFVNGQRIDKPGQEVDFESEIHIKKHLGYVSRGGLKLEKAMKVFPIELKGKTCMDIGASTGGFTDCMLQNGAAKVYSIDVGYGQLAWGLRNDERVVNLERTNIRYLSHDKVPDQIDFFSVDVSFISLTLVLPVIRQFVAEHFDGVCLIKPQFEAGKGKVGKKGVVREPEIHREVIEKIYGFAVENGFSAAGLDFSPVKGPEGNIEYLIHLKRPGLPCFDREKISGIVDLSHNQLNGGAVQ